MRENMHRFFRAARGAGVRISPAESIDAMRAVANIGIVDRGILRDTFLLTLAKTQDEKRALGDCFDLFFAAPAPSEPANATGEANQASPSEARGDADAGSPSSGSPSAERLGPLAQMLLAQDRAAIQAAIATASNAAPLSNIRFFTQRGLFSGRVLDAMGIARLRDDLDA